MSYWEQNLFNCPYYDGYIKDISFKERETIFGCGSCNYTKKYITKSSNDIMKSVIMFNIWANDELVKEIRDRKIRNILDY